MGQASSVLIYSPLEFVEYKRIADIDMPLESFLMMKLQATAEHAELIHSMAHKIRCVSEGWDVMPTIHIEIVKKTRTARIIKIMDSI
jgi:hypothetical protein